MSDAINAKATKLQIVAEIKRIAVKNGGRPPGIRTFSNETGLSRSSWDGIYWSRWSDALLEAGFAPNQRTPKFEDDAIFEMLVAVFRHYKRRPSVSDMRLFRRTVNPDFPIEAIRSRIGMDKLWGVFRGWINKQPNNFADIVSFLGEPTSTDVKENSSGELGTSIVDGYVYLLKSGDHYKIGRSDEIERRVKEVRTQMPESLVLTHTIRTDDPSGIERYWHDRFQHRRANGEWFRLSRWDVLAFKRRKFQ